MEYAVLECNDNVIRYLSWGFIIGAVAYFFRQTKTQTPYGRYVDTKAPLGVTCPAKLAWLLQESPSFLVPVLLLLTTNAQSSLGKQLLLWTFCMHYFQRTFIYSLMTKGRSSPLYIVISAIIFCSCNGFLQGHYLLHCATYEGTWLTNIRLAIGLILFFIGMAINIHSDHILRCLRKPGEIVYRIPKGGMFEYVSGANFFGEILEWCGYAIATWSLPTFSFAFFTMCSIGPRAYHHHRFYRERFDDYPKFRKAVIPYIL